MDDFNRIEISELRDACEHYNLLGREFLAAYTDEELTAEYNGAGPGRM